MTCDMGIVTCDTWWEVKILSKFQVPSPYDFGVKVEQRFVGKALVHDVSDGMN